MTGGGLLGLVKSWLGPGEAPAPAAREAEPAAAVQAPAVADAAERAPAETAPPDPARPATATFGFDFKDLVFTTVMPATDLHSDNGALYYDFAPYVFVALDTGPVKRPRGTGCRTLVHADFAGKPPLFQLLDAETGTVLAEATLRPATVALDWPEGVETVRYRVRLTGRGRCRFANIRTHAVLPAAEAPEEGAFEALIRAEYLKGRKARFEVPPPPQARVF
jgi:hypothetical protein